MMCANTLCNWLQEIYALLKWHALGVIKNTKFALNSNGWFSPHMLAYIVVNLHQVSKEPLQKSPVTLEFLSVNPGFGRISEDLSKIITKFNL